MSENFIEFECGETPFPEKIRNLGTIGNAKISPASKFVYLALRWSKSVLSKPDRRFDPSYLFMERRFGVSSTTYKKALDELEDIEAISVDYDRMCDKKYLIIDILKSKDDIAERIPSVIITTEVLTVPQKLFLALLWKMMYVDGNKNTISTYLSSHSIAKSLKTIGISRAATYSRLKELSDKDSGFINIIDMRDDGGFSVKVDVITKIWQYEDDLWAPFKMLGGKKKDYPVYKKPKSGDFKIEDGVVIKQPNNSL